jgi:hypothetical protein
MKGILLKHRAIFEQIQVELSLFLKKKQTISSLITWLGKSDFCFNPKDTQSLVRQFFQISQRIPKDNFSITIINFPDCTNIHIWETPFKYINITAYEGRNGDILYLKVRRKERTETVP